MGTAGWKASQAVASLLLRATLVRQEQCVAPRSHQMHALQTERCFPGSWRTFSRRSGGRNIGIRRAYTHDTRKPARFREGVEDHGHEEGEG